MSVFDDRATRGAGVRDDVATTGGIILVMLAEQSGGQIGVA